MISGTRAGQTTTAEAPITPFFGATVADPNDGAADTLTITLTGSGGALTGTGLSGGTNGVYTLASAPAATITSELDALQFTPTAGAPGTQGTTGFSLVDQSTAGTSATDTATTVTDTTASPSTNNTPTPLTPPTVSFDPDVTVTDRNAVVLTGTASDPSGIKGVEVFQGTQDLGAATVDPTTGDWSFIFNDGPGFHTDITATATANDTAAASTPSYFDLTTGVRRQPYAVAQDSYDTAYDYEGSTYFKASGKVYETTQYTANPDGSSVYVYLGGTAFDTTPYFAYGDHYAADGTTVTAEDVYYKDGHQTVQGLLSGQTLNSISNDTFLPTGGSNTFVFTKGFGADTITSFILGGKDHDTISLPDSAASRLGSILDQATNDASGGAVLQINKHDSITVQGVTVAELKLHQGDFSFHA